MRKKILSVSILLMLSIMFTSCLKQKPIIDENFFKNKQDLSIAVMPVNNQTQVYGLSPLSRDLIYGFLSTKNYKDKELNEIDRILAGVCLNQKRYLAELKPKQLGECLDSDLLYYANIEKFSRFYALIYSHFVTTINIEVIDTKTEKVVYKNKVKATKFKLSLPVSVIELLSSSIQNIWALRNEEKEEVLEYTFRKTMQNFPNLDADDGENAPEITSLVVDFPQKNLTNGDTISVSFVGTPAQKGSFKIQGLDKRISMKEMEAGEYYGEYIITDNDDCKFGLVSATLTNNMDLSDSVRTDLSRSFIIDTREPAPPEIYSYRTTDNGFLIEFDKNKQEDVKKYMIFKKESPDEEYIKIAQTDNRYYLDKKVKPIQDYYYCVKAIDTTDHESKLSKEFVYKMPLKKSTLIDKDIDKTFVFHAYSSPYYIEKPIKVMQNAELYIEAGVKVIFLEKGSLVVEGTLRADGKPGEEIQFISQSDDAAGVIIDNVQAKSSSISYSFFKDLKTGLQVLNGDLILSDSFFVHNQIGLSILNQISNVKITNCLFKVNSIAINNVSEKMIIEYSTLEKNHIAIKTNEIKFESKNINMVSNNIDYEK